MPYRIVLNNCRGLADQDRVALSREFDNLRTELDEMRAAYMALRALLIAGTAVGAGYNTAPTNLGTPAATAAATANRFTATL